MLRRNVRLHKKYPRGGCRGGTLYSSDIFQMLDVQRGDVVVL